MGDYDERAKRMALQKLRVTKDGKSIEMDAVEAVMSKQLTGALNGSVIAQREFLSASRTALAAHEAEIADDCQFWAAVKARNQAFIADAHTRGTPTPRVLPHPDDIVIDAKTGVRIIGPRDAASSAAFDASLRLRDALYLQQAMEDALDGKPLMERPSSGTPLITAMLINRYLPPSLKASPRDECDQIWEYTRRTKRTLLVDCRAAWRAAGVAMTRGKRLPPRDRFFPEFDLFMAFGITTITAGNDRDAANDAEQTLIEDFKSLKIAQARAGAKAHATDQFVDAAQ